MFGDTTTSSLPLPRSPPPAPYILPAPAHTLFTLACTHVHARARTHTLMSVLTRTQCAESCKTYDCSSRASLVRAGWKMGHSDAGAEHSGVIARCGGGANWFGWSAGNNVGSISITLTTSGIATLDFCNCWNAGVVNVYLDEAKIHSAKPNTPSKMVEFAVQAGAKLELKDEGGNAVVNLRSFKICAQGQPLLGSCVCATYMTRLW